MAAGGFDNSGLSDGLEVVTKRALPKFEAIDHFTDAKVGVHEGVDDPDAGGVGEGFAKEHHIIHCHIRIPGFEDEFIGLILVK